MQVLSSLSGIQFYAPSAGYAPTNSADVSSIASAYQVVSATATQLYAGTSYLTGVNSAPISAERAGNAANASLANSAWYDGTGRLISSLPDSAAVSSIASSYAESAASSKQDTLSFAYNTADQISSINGSALGGMDEAAVSSIASAYAESAASSKLDASASSSFYTTANESGFITGVDLSPYQTTADMSGYIPTSMSSDFQQASAMTSYALSSDVSATVDLVGTQSANWSTNADWAESASSSPSYIENKPDLVDIVAGPGIVVDNPDGNTLRVSMAADYEVELFYEPTNQAVSTTQEFIMSESIWHFSKVLITLDNMEFQNRTCTMLIDLVVSDTETVFCTPYCNAGNPGTLNIPWARFTINSSGNIKYENRGLIYGTWSSPAYTTGTLRGYRVKRVVGINRISGGN